MALIWSELFEEKKQRPIDMIGDSSFENGLVIYGPRHVDDIWAQYCGVSKSTEPQIWNIAQWALYDHPLDKNTPRTDLPGGGYQYETPSCTVTVRGDEETLIRMELRTDAEYKGHVRQFGEDWPHLLLEQHRAIDFEPAFGKLSSMDYSVSIMLESCKCNMQPEQINQDLHCAQLSHYFAIGDPEGMDWFWFGITFFDTRYEVFPGYVNIDMGKDDCSHKLIVSDPAQKYTGQIPKMGEWIDLSVDLLPYIRQAVEVGKAQGCLKNCEFERMKLFSTNIGFEIPGNFDAAFKLRKLELIGR